MTSVTDVARGIAGKGLESLKTNLGKAWDSLTTEERASCEALLVSIAEARLQELAGEDVSDFLPTLEAAYLQWKAIAKAELVHALTEVGKAILSIGGLFLGSVLHGVLV